MFERLPSNWMLTIKSIGYWFWLIPVLGIPMSYHASLRSEYSNAWPWLVLLVVFGLFQCWISLLGAIRPIPMKPYKCRRWNSRATTAC